LVDFCTTATSTIGFESKSENSAGKASKDNEQAEEDSQALTPIAAGTDDGRQCAESLGHVRARLLHGHGCGDP